MLAELNIVLFVKSDDEPDRIADRVFKALGTAYRPVVTNEGDTYYEGSGLGFRAELTTYDPYIEYAPLSRFGYELDIMSRYFDVDLDGLALDEILSEYFARELAFELNTETASEVLVDANDEFEELRVRVYRRNPQYRLDQAPTVPRVFMIEEHFRRENPGEPYDIEDEDEVDGDVQDLDESDAL